MNKLLHSLALAAVALSSGAAAQAANYCGDLENGYGPLDYRLRVGLEVVEKYHFTAKVEAGIDGVSSYLGDDLSYTLLAIPNHPRALSTMAKVGLRDKTLKVAHAKYPVECYFDRALRFTPDDGTVYGIYGNYLFALGRTDEALKRLKSAVELMPTDATINYNIGLVYLQKKDYPNALRHAETAYELGFPLPGLKNKLLAAGHWKDKPAQ